jgi:1,4-alpha-glucan branching enzyme
MKSTLLKAKSTAERDEESKAAGKPERIALWESEGGRTRAPVPPATLPKVKKIFSLHAPEAKDVRLVGDFNDWDSAGLALEKNKNGTWQVAVELEPGQYSYRFLVDGQWWDDPQCSHRVRNPYGTWNAQVEVACP